MNESNGRQMREKTGAGKRTLRVSVLVVQAGGLTVDPQNPGKKSQPSEMLQWVKVLVPKPKDPS